MEINVIINFEFAFNECFKENMIFWELLLISHHRSFCTFAHQQHTPPARAHASATDTRNNKNIDILSPYHSGGR